MMIIVLLLWTRLDYQWSEKWILLILSSLTEILYILPPIFTIFSVRIWYSLRVEEIWVCYPWDSEQPNAFHSISTVQKKKKNLNNMSLINSCDRYTLLYYRCMCVDGVRCRWHLTIHKHRRHTRTHYVDDDDNRLSSDDVFSPIFVWSPYILQNNTVYFFMNIIPKRSKLTGFNDVEFSKFKKSYSK